jgi:hypothetical protein
LIFILGILYAGFAVLAVCRYGISYCAEQACSRPKASVVNNYEDNSWAFVVITFLFA